MPVAGWPKFPYTESAWMARLGGSVCCFRYALAGHLATEGQYQEALEMVDGLSVPALTAGDSTPGWEHRLQALRGQILMQSGRAQEGRPLLVAAVGALSDLGTQEEDEMAAWQRLLQGPGGAGN